MSDRSSDINERGVLAASLIKPEAADALVSELGDEAPKFFEDSRHASIAAAVVRLVRRQTPVDYSTTISELAGHEELNTAGGAVYVVGLAKSLPSSHRAPQYRRALRDAVETRAIGQICAEVGTASKNGTPPDELRQRLLDGLDSTTIRSPEALEPVDLSAWPDTEPPPKNYLFEGLLLRNSLAGMTGAGGLGKGMLTQTLIMSLAIGKPLISKFAPVRPACVLWLESEDDPHEIHARFNAIATSYDLDDTEKTAFATNVTLYAGAAVALCAPIDGTVKPTNQFRWLERTVSDLQPGLIVIDPLSHFFGGDENSNIEMAAFLNTLKGLTDLVEGGAALWINHHVSKQRENDSSSAAGRGASAFRDAIRSGFALTPPTPEDVKTFGIVTPSNFVKLTHVKSNWTAQVDAPIFLKRGHAGVLHEVDSREMRESIETAMAEQMAVAITELIGDNPDALTCNEIKGRPQGQHIRDELRDKFGKWANKQGISSALNDAVARGKLTVEVEKKDRTTRNVPRRCDDAPRYARGSAHRD